MDIKLRYRLLRRLWQDTSITPEEVETLIESGSIEPNDMILWSVMYGREDLVSTLINKGADPNKRGYNDEIPALLRAAESYADGTATFSPIKLLMRAGANPHNFVEWCDEEGVYYGTIAVVAYKVFRINILKTI